MLKLSNRFAKPVSSWSAPRQYDHFVQSLAAVVLVTMSYATSVLAQSSDTISTTQDTAQLTTDLVSVYERAREFDAEFQAGQFDLESTRTLVPQARSALRPQLTLGAETGLATVEDDGEGPFAESAISLSLTQTLFDVNSSRELDQAQVSVRQAEAQYAAIGQTLILRVATAYFEVLRAQVNVEFSQSELEAIDRQREQAERRFDVGLVPVTDVRTAQAQFDLAVAQEIVASNELFTAREALLRISGIDVQNPTPLADDLPLTPPQPADIDAWVALALEQNLELVSANLADQSNQMQIGVEKAVRYPTINFVGSATSTATDRFGQLDTNFADFSVQFNLPLSTGGRINASVAQARADARASNQELLAQERTTVQQTRDAYRGVQASISQVRALQQALASTEASTEATEAGFRAGTRTSVEVLQALRDTFSAKSDFAGARYDYIINTLNLKAASGTLSEDDLYAINRFLAVPE